ncbi:MAG: VOC family protein, partial [Acidimicrobiia bacterium]
MTFAPGQPAWIELDTPDRQSAMVFYGSVFGWTFESIIRNNSVINVCARKDQRDAAAVIPRDHATPAWHIAFASDDLDATCARAIELNGAVQWGPIDSDAGGRRAQCQDPQGGIFRIAEVNGHLGFGVTHQPDTYTWCEYDTREVLAAIEFYEQLFDWKTAPAPGTTPYTLCAIDGSEVAGIMPMPDQLGAMPPYWLVYFASADVDRTLARVQDHGGSV